MIGPAVSTNPQQPLVALMDVPKWEEHNGKQYETATRINGCFACPDCGLIWPLFEDVEEWTEGKRPDGRWHAKAWGPAHGFCEECGTFICEGFDCDYVIRGNG